MKSIVTLLAALPCIAVGLLLTPSTAEAADRCGVVGIVNQTKTTLNFNYKVGDGAWMKQSIKPGEEWYQYYWYPTANSKKSPTFRISFDSDLTNSNYKLEYTLTRFAAPEPLFRYAKQYAFQYDGGTRMIDLRSIN